MESDIGTVENTFTEAHFRNNVRASEVNGSNGLEFVEIDYRQRVIQRICRESGFPIRGNQDTSRAVFYRYMLDNEFRRFSKVIGEHFPAFMGGGGFEHGDKPWDVHNGDTV